MVKRLLMFVFLAMFMATLCPVTFAIASEEEVVATVVVEEDAETPEAAPDKKSKSFGHRLLFYIPNRIFDVFDLVRARVRIGPGFAVGAHVTRYGEVYLGAYASVFAGLPGPRLEPGIPWPIGFDSRAGVAVIADASIGGSSGYGYGEIGFGFQAALIGLDVGVDPVEALDLVAGLLFLDLTGDDY